MKAKKNYENNEQLKEAIKIQTELFRLIAIAFIGVVSGNNKHPSGVVSLLDSKLSLKVCIKIYHEGCPINLTFG